MTAPTTPRTVLVSVAHPDDESFGCGSLIAQAARAGMRVVVVCATRGEEGDDATGQARDRDALAARRESELRDAAAVLGASAVEVLGFRDSGWSGEAPAGALVLQPERAQATMRDALLRHRPAVVVTMDPTGSDGHRDHAAIGAATTRAFHAAVDWPASLYHWCLPRSLMRRWAEVTAAADPSSVYVEVELGRDDCDVTTVVDVRAVLAARRRAIATHASQTSPFDGLDDELADAFLTTRQPRAGHAAVDRRSARARAARAVTPPTRTDPQELVLRGAQPARIDTGVAAYEMLRTVPDAPRVPMPDQHVLDEVIAAAAAA